MAITNFWSNVLDDHWSKNIYRPKIIAWWLVLYSSQMILFSVDIAVIWDICWSRHYWGNWSEEKARRLEGLGRKTSPFFLTVLFVVWSPQEKMKMCIQIRFSSTLTMTVLSVLLTVQLRLKCVGWFLNVVSKISRQKRCWANMFKEPSISPARPLLKPPVIILERRTRLPGEKSPYMSLSLVRSAVSFPAVLLDIKKN